MFLIRTRLGPSPIHGVGVFALEAVPAGTVVWRYDAAFDRIVTPTERDGAPRAFRAHLDAYAYPSADLGGATLLCCDHAKFLNHSDHPNTAERPFMSVAARPIAVGEEITCDYGTFCVGWTGLAG
ncbi:SET domain-containing protein [Lichenibacterium ramalinae]|uniref:SET domain-containing protein-lysine N-methyltransferase n=1 Tax=Lichenibacterium ramalinae TaxID=2316527 RepID=A0A4Q2R9H9_9HYPH|nr:SET domain-containing protein-lysine N-methyltransferase [Lichenibacterium ramalinae]RYB02565.1 SET domain-containing protein-lysine N-methyltransferase [Lichenibacterium ramalinae]